jgi:DNA-binding response OmpR family regulator
MTTPPNSPASVLVVEDDEQISHLLQFMLEQENYTVHVARDGLQARQFIEQKTPPDLVLFDVMLPFYDGFALVALLRAQPAWKTTPVIMLTSKAQEKDIVKALQSGATDYILKPFQPAELLARVKRALAPSNV